MQNKKSKKVKTADEIKAIPILSEHLLQRSNKLMKPFEQAVMIRRLKSSHQWPTIEWNLN